MSCFISWNCRGVGVASTIRALRDLVSQYTPRLLFLCETKARQQKMKNLCNLLAFDHVLTVDAIGRSGGLALFWKNTIDVQLISCCKNFIHVLVNINDMGLSCYFTGVYGEPDPNLRRDVWDKISHDISINSVPWGCMGDFNEILFQHEKEGLRPHDNRLIDDFRKFLDDNSLTDVELKGCKFTWSNNRIEGHVREKIDRLLVNAEWLLNFPNAYVTALPAVGSDHSPLVLCMDSVCRKKKKLFKYEEFWEDNEEISSIINNHWSGAALEDISGKISHVSKALEDWSNKNFKKANVEIRKQKKQLQQLCNLPVSEETLMEQRKCRLEIERLWEQEEKYWRARSRVKWLTSGDRNSKFFHATTIQRRAINRITRLRDDEGNWVDNSVAMQGLIQSYFANLFKSSNPSGIAEVTGLIPCRISADMNDILLRQVEEWEVKQAVFDLGPHKAPGPDGLNGLFYQHHWEEVKGDIVEAVRKFFISAHLPPGINLTHITLVPKTQHPENIGQFRPISCCNFIYKVFSKVMANRMRMLLNLIISDNQSAFIKGRQIQDNLIIAHEFFNSLKKKRGRGTDVMMIKLDMNKAYDRLEWKFVEQVMLAFGFHHH